MKKTDHIPLDKVVDSPKSTIAATPKTKKTYSLRIKTKLIIAFLLVGLIPLGIVGIMSLMSANKSLSKQAFNQLESVREIKKTQLEQYFKDRKGDMGALSETVSTLRQEAFDKLKAVREIKRSTVEMYYELTKNQIITFSSDASVVEAMDWFNETIKDVRTEVGIHPEEMERMKRELLTYYNGEFTEEYKKVNNGDEPDIESYFKKLDDQTIDDIPIVLQYYYIRDNKNPLGSKHLLGRASDNSSYTEYHAQRHSIFKAYAEAFGYYDIFLVDSETGTIVYSVYKELDFGTSLINGPYAETQIGEAFRKANKTTEKNSVVLVDFGRYFPSYDKPASFIASPIFSEDKKIGVAIFQYPIEALNNIMSERTGLGDTGETYLVGQDLLMRSDSYNSPKCHNVIASFSNPDKGKVDTEAAKAALAGKSGVMDTINYNGHHVLSAYSPVNVLGITFGLLTEVDVAEAFCPKGEDGEYYFSKYISKYGYHNFYLINSDGKCFYTVAKESDDKANFINGKYSNTNLGKLVRKVLETKQYGLVDIEPYAPSNNDPALFIAQPIVCHDKVEVIAALQISHDEINTLMQQRDGMGETGETFLVGMDKLMRSDSFLDPVNHSVEAAFKDRDKGGIDTDATRGALSGNSDTKIITNYNGHHVLAAYTPVDIEDNRWALIAEIDKDEAFASVNSLKNLISVIAIACVGAIVVVSIMFARSISNPLRRVVYVIREIASGDFTQKIKVKGKDEIGILGENVNGMVERLGKMINDVKHNATTVASSSEELSTISTHMVNASEDMSNKSNSVAGATEQMSTNFNTMASATEEISANIADLSSTAEEMSHNVNTISSAIEEMSVSISDVEKNAKEALNVSSTAKQMSANATTTMNTLGDAANEIGKVTEVIKRIAEQTNLLALNATIEAASAGDAGKGFAVVANEIKELANQSAQAAEDIATKIGGVQANTGIAIEVIKDVSNIIDTINTSVDVIAKAVEQQTQAANDISSNIAETNTGAKNTAASIAEINKGTNDVSKNVGEAAKGANDVACSIQSVSLTANESTASAQEINKSSSNLAEISGELNKLVEQFKIEKTAA